MTAQPTPDTTTAAAPADQDTAPEMITNREQYLAYADTHPAQHAAADDGTCACGYPYVPAEMRALMEGNTAFPTQAEHAEARFIGDLGNVLPSDHSEPDADGIPRPVPWRLLVQQLSEAIDQRDRSIDPRFAVLMRWVLDHQYADVEELAAVTTMHPNYLARLLGVTIPAPSREPEPHQDTQEGPEKPEKTGDATGDEGEPETEGEATA